MITINNLEQVLTVLDFQKENQIWTKEFTSLNCSLSVDFSQKKLIYPEEIKGRERNDTFAAPENFVVFECVYRLLDKGYRPEHIILEKEWHLGHDLKSGRADICVKSSEDTMLFIIECKTYGKEYDKALKDTKNDGGQLFSYWQQEGSTKWLMLYTVGWNEKIIHETSVVNCSDDENIILLAKTDKSIKLYSNAHTVYEKYEAWAETYESKLYDDLIFSDDSVAYQIGVKPLRKRDLLNFSPEDSIVNQFEEILRHNNVSDKENAFNRLIALFICKLVDESKKGEDDEVEFQYKQGTDTYETLQDRLQRLHHEGMNNFMHEEVFYIESDYPEQLFQQYTGSARKRAIEDLKKTIRCLKYYSNNDFAFKDVHNEELFYQNGKILVEMVQLFEKYRIVYTSKHQFLGDLFEQLLNKGFKQNEGQFFTPIPITRFIWDSLPIESRICTDRGTIYPKVIDYACGAGHFLTEAIEAINFYANRDGNNDWVRDYIYGIEKDYRLARVAKVSLFMNGAGDGNIIFSDGLENAPDKSITNGTFDILVANPPYSVKYFKQHLALKNNHFNLLPLIGKDGKEIEVLFVERIAQLLKPCGMAAVVLPVSIISNGGCYIGAREEIIKNFYIRAIVSLGSKTFGETGTNTVVMFLEKYNEPPKRMQIMADTVEAILSGQDLTDWTDQNIFIRYVETIGVEQEQYKKFTEQRFSLNELQTDSYFKMYADTFADLTEIKKLINTKSYMKMSQKDKDAVYQNKLYNYIKAIEIEKIYYFALTYGQKTVIIQAPTEDKAQKDFLGYTWSKRKGNEGIQIISPGGKLYNDTNRRDNTTLAAAIRHSFMDEIPIFTEEQSAYASVIDASDMLDFSRGSFNMAFSLSVNKKFSIQSKYELRKLESFCEINMSKSEVDAIPSEMLVSFIEMASVSNEGFITNKVDRPIEEVRKGSYTYFAEGDIIIAKITPCMENGKCAIAVDLTNNIGFGSSEFHVFRCDNSVVLTGYLFKILNNPNIRNAAKQAMTGASGHRRVPESFYSELQIPIPPIEIQQKIVIECSKIDNEYNAIRMSINEYQSEIENLFIQLDATVKLQGHELSLSDNKTFSVSIGKRIVEKELVSNGEIPVYSANVLEPFGYIDKLLITDFSVPSVLWGIDGDWMTNFMPKDMNFYPTDHCGVLRCLTNDIHPRYLTHILEVEGKKIGFSRNYRASIERIEGIRISVPDIAEQEKVISQVTALEQQIAILQKKLVQLSGKTIEILNSYLQ